MFLDINSHIEREREKAFTTFLLQFSGPCINIHKLPIADGTDLTQLGKVSNLTNWPRCIDTFPERHVDTFGG